MHTMFVLGLVFYSSTQYMYTLLWDVYSVLLHKFEIDLGSIYYKIFLVVEDH